MELTDYTISTDRRNKRRPVATSVAAGLLLFGAGATAEEAGETGCPTEGSRTVQIARATRGDAFVTPAGQEVLLAGILAPGSDGADWTGAMVEEARLRLESLVTAGEILLAMSPDTPDRYGRLSAEIFVGGEWLQGRLLREGLVRAAPDGTSPCAVELLAAEEEARSRAAGHWSDGNFKVLSAEAVERDGASLAGSFQIVEGIVKAVAEYRGRYFVNFGDDYRTDFTVTIAPADARNFRNAGVDIETWNNAHVRVRGWLELYNGPNLSIAHPGAVEILD